MSDRITNATTVFIAGIMIGAFRSATVTAPKPLSRQRAAPLPSRKLSLNSASATSTRATLAFISENYLELTASIGAIAIVIAIAILAAAAKKERALMILSPSIAKSY
jgi:hypothetical protein